MDLFAKIASLFTGGTGAVVGSVATGIGVLTALAPLAIYLTSAKSNEVFVSVTYREAAFWGAIIAVNLLVAYWTRRNA